MTYQKSLGILLFSFLFCSAIAQPKTGVRIQVLDGNRNKPISKASVFYVIGKDAKKIPVGKDFSDSNGELEDDLDAGVQYKLGAEAKGYATTRIEDLLDFRPVIQGDIASNTVVIKLFNPESTITGDVYDEDDRQPIQSAKVIIYDDNNTKQYEGQTDEDGHFEIRTSFVKDDIIKVKIRKGKNYKTYEKYEYKIKENRNIIKPDDGNNNIYLERISRRIDNSIDIDIKGRILAEKTKEAIANLEVSIEVDGQTISKITNAGGLFSFRRTISIENDVDLYIKVVENKQYETYGKKISASGDVDVGDILLQARKISIAGTAQLKKNNKVEKISDVEIYGYEKDNENSRFQKRTSNLGKFESEKLFVPPEDIRLYVLSEIKSNKKFTLKNHQYFIKSIERTKGNDYSINLKDNHIINQPRWLMSTGLILISGLSFGISENRYNLYEKHPKETRYLFQSRLSQAIGLISIGGVITIPIVMKRNHISKKVEIGYDDNF